MFENWHMGFPATALVILAVNNIYGAVNYVYIPAEVGIGRMHLVNMTQTGRNGADFS